MLEWRSGAKLGRSVIPESPWCFPILWVSAFRSMAGGLQFIGFWNSAPPQKGLPFRAER